MKTFQPQKAGFWCTIFSLSRDLDSMHVVGQGTRKHIPPNGKSRKIIDSKVPANSRGYVISQEGIDVIKEFTFGGPIVRGVNDSFL